VNSDHAKKNDERPPNPLNNATISGMEVIFTLKAINEPITAPIETPIKTITGFTTLMMVTATAMNMADADKKLPLTAVSSLPSILIPLINKIDENM
jgi:hypothetical protein